MNDQRALVVDDSKVGRLTMMKKLEAIGFKVDLVESGQEALDYLDRQRPDMIFMDHMMPDMDGFETTQRIKAAPATRDIPIIIISGNDDEDFVQQARSIGALNAISKPPAPGVLEALLRDLPHLAAAPAPAVPTTKAAPQAAEKPRAPALDQAAVHALVERMLGEAMDHLHHDLLADLGKQMEVAFADERKTQQDWSEGWRLQLDQATAGMDELRKGAVAAEDLGRRLQALEQRLAPLEAEAGQPQPDMDALGKTLEQRFAARLDALSAEVQQLGEGVQSDEAGLEHRLAEAEQRLVTLEGVEPPPALDGEAMLAAMEDRLSPRLEELRNTLFTHVEERSSSVLQEALGAIEPTEAVPGLDADAILAAVDERMNARLADMRNDFLGQMDEQSSRFQEAMGDANSALEQRFADMAQRLEAMESAQSEADQEERAETILAALDERIDTRLDAMRNVLLAKWEEQQPAPPDAAALDALVAPLQEQHQALKGVFDGQQARLEAYEQAHAALREEMAAQGEAMGGRIAEEGERILARLDAQQAQLAADLDTERTRMEAWDDGMARILALEERLQALDQGGLDASAQRALEQRFAQMREVIGAVLQPSYPGLDAAAGLGSASLKAMESEMGELRERVSETRLRQLVAETVGSVPAVTEPGATQAAALSQERMQTEVDQLKGKVKTLTILLATGGVALLAAMGLMLLGG